MQREAHAGKWTHDGRRALLIVAVAAAVLAGEALALPVSRRDSSDPAPGTLLAPQRWVRPPLDRHTASIRAADPGATHGNFGDPSPAG